METVEHIWSAYRAALRAFLCQRVADRDDVEDLLQEILIKSHNSLPQLREHDNLKAWLFRIARNVTVDFYRRRGRDQSVHPDDLWYAEDDTGILNDMEACVVPFLVGLPEDEAQLLAAVDLGDTSQKAYAAELGISYSTLKSRVQLARRNLRRLFDNCCHMTVDAQGRLVDYRPKSGRCGNC